MKNIKNTSSGHILITLLVIMVVSIIISTAAVSWVVDNTIGSSKTFLGISSMAAAESGVENAMISLLRDPSYTGEVMIVGDATVTISVTGTTEKTIISQSVENNHSRKLEVTASYIDNMLTITSWQEST